MSERIEEQVPCPACGAEKGADCRTVVRGVDTAWTHDARIYAASSWRGRGIPPPPPPPPPGRNPATGVVREPDARPEPRTR